MSHAVEDFAPSWWQWAPAAVLVYEIMRPERAKAMQWILQLATGLGKSRIIYAILSLIEGINEALIRMSDAEPIHVHLYFASEALMVRDKDIM